MRMIAVIGILIFTALFLDGIKRNPVANLDVLVIFWPLTFILSILVHARLLVTPEGVRVRNVVFEWFLPWSKIVSFHTASCLDVELQGGRVVSAWAVQRSNLYAMMNRRSRVDRVIDDLSRYRAESAIEELDRPAVRRIVRPNAVLVIGFLYFPVLWLVVGSGIGGS